MEEYIIAYKSDWSVEFYNSLENAADRGAMYIHKKVKVRSIVVSGYEQVFFTHELFNGSLKPVNLQVKSVQLKLSKDVMAHSNAIVLNGEIQICNDSNSYNSSNCNQFSVVHNAGVTREFTLDKPLNENFLLLPVLFKFLESIAKFHCWEAFDLNLENQKLKRRIQELGG